jgi:cytochrome P450
LHHCEFAITILRLIIAVLIQYRLGHGIFSADGTQWERARTILRPQFTRDQVGDLNMEERHVKNLLHAISSKSGDQSEIVDLQPLFFRLSMDSASEFLFGQSTNTQLSALSEEALLKNAEDTEFVKAFEACNRRIMMAMLLNEQYALFLTKSFKDKCRLCHRYIDKFVRKALDRHNSFPYEFLIHHALSAP